MLFSTSLWLQQYLRSVIIMQMSTKSQMKLSPLNRATRNTVILFLYNAGYTVTAISQVMNMTPSTVSRVTDAQVDNKRLMEIIFGS